MQKTTGCTYRNLVVWQESVELAQMIYRVIRRLPDEEKYGLRAQLTRAAISVPSNVAEGAGRGSTREFLRYLLIARGSLNELHTLLVIVRGAGMLPGGTDDALKQKTSRVLSLLNGLIRSTRARLRQ